MRLGVAGLTAVTAVWAQPVTTAKSGAVGYLEGKVFLDDQQLDFSSTHFPQIKENGVLRTEDGRAEVLLTPGVILRLGENSSLKLLTNRLIDTRLELLTGSAVLEADTVEKDTSVTVVCKNGVVVPEKVGIYRFDADPGRIKVFKGEATVKLGQETVESTTVGTGKMMNLAGDLASVEKFDVEDLDALDRWSSRRGMVLAMANPSAAKTASSSGGFGLGRIGVGMGPIYGGYGMGLGMGMGYCGWVWNPWYGVYTYVPCYGTYYSPYGYPFWSPYTVGGGFYRPVRSGGGVPPAYGRMNGGSGGATPSTISRGSATSMGRAGATGTSAGINNGGTGGFGGGATGGGFGGGGVSSGGGIGRSAAGGGGGGGFAGGSVGGGGHAGAAGGGGGGRGK